MKYLLIIILFFSLFGCSKNSSPLEDFLNTNTPDEIYKFSGEIDLVESCKLKHKDEECINQIKSIVSHLKNNGFTSIDIKHFNEPLINKFIIKLELSELLNSKNGLRNNLEIFN